jgi:hypothetical protein
MGAPSTVTKAEAQHGSIDPRMKGPVYPQISLISQIEKSRNRSDVESAE